MCIERKPRVAYTLQEDVAALRFITASNSGVIGGGSAAVKLQAWVEAAERISAQGIEVTGDGLRRHIADLVKKHKQQGPEPAEGRMRWGMPWPKSDEELERDRLIVLYMERLEESKKVVVAARRNTPKAVTTTPAEQPQAHLALPPVTIPLPKENTKKASTSTAPAKKPIQARISLSVPSRARTTVSTKEAAPVKGKQPEPVLVDDDHDDVGVTWFTESPSTASATSVDRMKLDLKRRRLEMEERTQNRMLDIQAEQIALQREQLRLQAETMRSVAESTNAIARALQALEKRLE